MGWMAASFLHHEPFQPPAFDEERDLPPLPPASENGWTVIARRDASSFEPEPPSALLSSVDEGPPPRAEWEAMRGELEAWELPPDARAALDDALARPSFVIACELSLTEPCPVMTWVRAHRAAAGLALRDAALGRDEEALARAEQLLRADRDALSQARTVLAAMAASTMTMEAIELTALLGAIVSDVEAASPSMGERLDSLERALAELEPASWTLERALIGEAIVIRRAIDTLPPSETRGSGLTPDLARVARLSDEHMRASIEYARDPSRVAPPEPPRAGLLWRALDPAGPLVLETMSTHAVPLVDELEEHAARAERRIRVARAALALARHRAPADSP